jgi:hypothetical protein
MPDQYQGRPSKGANTGKIGVVLMADLDTKESGWDHTDGKLTAAMRFSSEWSVGDLIGKYGIRSLGGHKEYADQQGDGRTCPGDIGMRFVAELRQKFHVGAP